MSTCKWITQFVENFKWCYAPFPNKIYNQCQIKKNPESCRKVILYLQQVVQEVKKMIEADSDVSNDTVMNAIIVDQYLWDYRREHADEIADKPIHKTRCIYY